MLYLVEDLPASRGQREYFHSLERTKAKEVRHGEQWVWCGYFYCFVVWLLCVLLLKAPNVFLSYESNISSLLLHYVEDIGSFELNVTVSSYIWSLTGMFNLIL